MQLSLDDSKSVAQATGISSEDKLKIKKRSKMSKEKRDKATLNAQGIGRIPKGTRYGKLTVVDTGRTVNKVKMSLCQCDCGTFTVVSNAHLISGHTTNCGCSHFEENEEKKKQRESNYRHPIYQAWRSMRERCYSPNAQQYHNYGARGIIVCEAWRKSFKAFQQWALNNGWKKGFSLDRVNNDGNYEPTNCRWTDNVTQGRNRRTNVLLTYKGETKTVADWAEVTGLYYTTILERIRKGWSPEDVIEKPKRAYNRGGHRDHRQYAKFTLFVNPLILSTGQQKKMNFVTKTIFTDSRVENGMRIVEMAAKPHTAEIHRVCPPGTRIALTVTFLCPYPSGTPEEERVERGLMGEGFDCDNKYKAIGDAFTNAGWWPDDRYVTSLMIEKRRTTAMPRIEIIVEPDTIREPSLLSDEELLDDEPIVVDADIDEDDDFSLFSAMNRDEKPETLEFSDAPSLFSTSTAKPAETNPLAELSSGEASTI